MDFARRKWFRKCFVTAFACLIIGVLYIKAKNIAFWGDYLIRGLLGCAITLLMLQCLTKYAIGNPVSRFLGKISFEVFLLHGMTFSVLTQLGTIKESGVYILLSLAVTIVVSVLVNCVGGYLCKRINNWLNKRYAVAK